VLRKSQVAKQSILILLAIFSAQLSRRLNHFHSINQSNSIQIFFTPKKIPLLQNFFSQQVLLIGLEMFAIKLHFKLFLRCHGWVNMSHIDISMAFGVGLPDGISAHQKSKFGYILEAL
jgi:hypothetical protein